MTSLMCPNCGKQIDRLSITTTTVTYLNPTTGEVTPSKSSKSTNCISCNFQVRQE